MSKLDRPMPSVSLAGDTDGTEDAIIKKVTKDVNGNLNGIVARTKYTKKSIQTFKQITT